MLDRMEWAYHRRDRYGTWCAEVLASPYSIQDKLEYAVISAHCPFQVSIRAFLATRDVVGLAELAEALDDAGVIGPANRAVYITDLRELEPYPTYPYSQYRREVKLPGLGYCKLSFACALIDPVESDVVCLDTHLAQVYGVKTERLWRRLDLYEGVERQLKEEAAQVGLAPFAYQWSVWDWKRLQGGRGVNGALINSHSFLWQTPEYLQLPLFSSREREAHHG